MVEVQWMYHYPFTQLIPRLGGIHMLMSFVGVVGTLMAETGLAEIIETVFEGVVEMLTGKKFHINMRVRVADEVLVVLI